MKSDDKHKVNSKMELDKVYKYYESTGQVSQ